MSTGETKYREAPQNQPTENIELQLRTADKELEDWIDTRYELEDRLNSARYMESTLYERREELAWQLDQRRKS